MNMVSLSLRCSAYRRQINEQKRTLAGAWMAGLYWPILQKQRKPGQSATSRKTRGSFGARRLLPGNNVKKMTNDTHEILTVLTRIANALDRLAPPTLEPMLPSAGDVFVWQAQSAQLQKVDKVNRVALDLLHGVERQRDILLANTLRFAQGRPANNALLWGARGMGKSSMVKAVHAEIVRQLPGALALVEIHREDIPSLPRLLAALRTTERRAILYCDDLSFDQQDDTYKSLKAVLDGGVEGRPENVLFYATSNRRHLMPRDMIENERSTAINPDEAVQEKVSLSDRFGLWLGFHHCDQPTFLQMIRGYCAAAGITLDDEELTARAVEWSRTRGSRSGRVAWQFMQDLAGELGVPLAASDELPRG
jgi:uncharacterized protein